MKPAQQLEFKEFCIEFFEAITDLEKSYVKTVYELSVKPEKVLLSYISGNRDKYFKVFRYLLVSLFISYLTYILLFNPSSLGGDYYNFVLSSIKENLKVPLEKGTVRIDEEAFSIYYTKFSSLLGSTYKIFGLLSIPPLCLIGFFLMRPMGLTIISWIIVSTFLSAHLSIFSSIFSLFFNLASSNLFLLSSFTYFFGFIYFTFSFYRLGLSFQLKRPFVRATIVALLSVLLWSASTMALGMGLGQYSMKGVPSFVIKVDSGNSQ